jgi:thiosulfate/3-mercaptopyruvate sulfurtransferase
MQSSGAESDMVVDPDWISAHLNDPTVQVVEVDVSRTAYDNGHIPGAILWNAYTDLRHADYSLLNTLEFEALLSTSGLTPDATIVFYGYAPYLGAWLMKSYGHDRIRLMDGPRDRWLSAGHPWSTEIPTPAASSYGLPVEQSGLGASRDAVRDMIGMPGKIILDVRSQAEYDGERFWPSGATEGAGRPGHIPGAVHVPIELLRTEDGGFKSVEEMQRILRDRGVVPESEVASYCTIGNRASQAWFALKYLLGYPEASVYYGSWAEWGTVSDTPIES